MKPTTVRLTADELGMLRTALASADHHALFGMDPPAPDDQDTFLRLRDKLDRAQLRTARKVDMSP